VQYASGMTDSQNIRDRAFVFACAAAKLALRLQSRPGIRCLVDQLLRSATSVGANLEEAKAGSSTREFVRYVEISLREAREAGYWLRIFATLEVDSSKEVKELSDEAAQIARILGAIVVKTKVRLRVGYAVFAFCILNFALLS
jgi:four helix bundle protein